MANAGKYYRPRTARLWGFILALGLCTSAQAAWDTASGLTLSAPESIRELIETHFELPGTPMSDETARAVFMRRAGLEIGELLATEGYFMPQFILHPAEGQGVQSVEVVPGPRTSVAELNIVFKGELALHHERAEQLRVAWGLGVGLPFRSADWEQAKTALLARVAREDYAAAQITLSHAEVVPATHSARLMLVIDSGPAFRFGALVVSGLDHYQKILVTRAAPFRAGDPYSRDALLSLQTRLQNMPQFSSVLVNISTDISTHAAAPIQVVLSEAKSSRVAIGLGYSTNSGARTELNYRNYNFLGHAWNFSSGLRLEKNRQTFYTGIDTLPDDEGYLLSWGAGREATQIEGLKTDLTKLNVTRSRIRGGIETRLGLNWQQENRKPLGGIQERAQALVPDWQWLRRAVDDLMYPRLGNVTEIRIGGGSSKLLSNQDFCRGYARHQIWWPVGERDVFSARIEAGFTAAPSRVGIPQEYLFRAGGTQSVRGYAYQSLGVHEGLAVVGGRALLTGSLEYTHWLNSSWGAALFADAGGAADVWPNLHLAKAYGSGVRWRSPVGPLALDLAWGRDTHALRLHFSIAMAL